MNFGRGFPIPPENQLGRLDFWVPATPEKPIPARSNPITMDAQVSQLDRANWSDLLGIYGGLLQETVNCTAPTDDFNQVVGLAGDYLNLDDTPANGRRLDQNGGSFVQNSGYDCTWNNNLSTENVGILASSNGSVFDNSFPQVEKRWTEPTNLDNCLVSKQRINGDNLQTVPNDGFQVPYQCHFNLNSPPRSETDAASSSVSSSLQFAPVTPEQRKQLENNQLSETLNLAVYESSSQEKDELDKAIGNNCDELLQHIVESSAAISIPFKEKNGSEEGGNNLGIDINKTPQQKTPKRRKHRPKVIKEGKAKRGPKPKAATNENQPAKRKYVRKNSLQNSSDQQGNELSEKQTEKRKYVRKKGIENVVNETVVDEGRSSSCRRVLNFDLENKNGHQIETNQENRMALNLNLDPQVVADEWTGQRSTQNDAKNQQLVASDVATNKMLAFMALTQQKATPAPLKGHNLNAIARNMNVIKGNQWQNGYYNQTNLDRTRETTLQNIAQLLTKDISSSDERRGFKRDSCHNTEPMGSQFLYREMLRANGNDFGADCSESFKRKRTIDNVHESITGSSCIDANGVQRENPTPYISSFQRENASNLSSWINRLTGNGYIQHKAAEDYYQNHQNSSEVHSHTEKLRQKSSQVTNLNLMTAITNHNAMKPRLQEMVATPNHVQPIETLKAIVSAKKKTVKPASAKQASSKDRVVLEEHKDDQGYRKAKIQSYQEYSKRERGPKQEQKIRISVESITYQLKGLNINSGSSEIAERDQRALVPFNAGGTIVPFEGLGAIKRRKPRPKVDLDPETNRIWNLLMGIEASETTEAMNKDKEKWWEEERKVFQGRVDSFIARMHLVQGDRRFSRWKGSVVDSVIGVFLTQNVSDHLSSSAYMSLASKFPLKSTTASKTCYQKETTVLVEEPEIRILEKDEIIKFQEKIAREPAYHQRSFEQRTNIALISGRSTLEDEHRRRAEEAVLPRNSLDSLILQASMGNKFSLGSNSEGEDPTHNLLRLARSSTFQEYSRPVVQRFAHGHNQSVNPASNWQYPGLDRDISMRGSNGFSYPIDPMIRQTQDSNLPSTTNYWLSKISGSRTSEVAHFSTLRQESQSALPASAAGNTNANSADYMSNRMRHAAGNEITFLHSGMPRFQTRPHANNHKEEGPKTSQLERMIIKEAPRPVEGLAKWQSPLGKQLSDNPSISGRTADAEERNTAKDELKLLQNKATEANAKWQINSSIKEGTDTSSVKKKKAESEKKNEYDWDSLRRRVQCSSERKERGKDAMDSLDYEALRCANVSEISNAIKERGMNNLLADRIKDFLNRLVREHGSIDLEWLRDVPPDKAKDYLLSIRGLGLKSVECVRLLTLHHLAFPVDTNVGRIAVRLGWVPLQPLPESLQLHLLELYPILESIQKYLWPRLCKLDQLTLYELHYQMITFGKVFCTKSKPNCNACPMRGECRHFASAFASARLALPGPEERSMTCSVVPIAANETPAAVLTPLPLPPLENNISTELGYTAGKCEPIIEEPATPEPPAEVSQSDIEDAFYEDPDEIPTIKLNMEEFSQNLQTFMQENMDLQEGDMSKALVALSQEVASIPQPKLKNVSRLRTEHQVYELPDSHPLLNRLDRREPDDPSPYLLAIWTPGETATSIQPPERRCGSQESGNLCNEKTCFSCNSVREANSQIVRGTLLIPCRTAMRGSFPLNGTYFQVNEVFADHESSLNPIDVPRAWLWNLSRRTVYFGTSVSTIFKGLSTEGIQYCFWRGFVCVRGFDQKTRAPRPLMARLHFPASKLAKARNEGK